MEQKARKLQLEHYQAWLKLYGSDELLFDDGHKLRNAVEEFYHHWTYHVVNPENGLTPAQSYERQHGGSPPRLSVPMPQHLLESDDVAALMDPLGGLSFVTSYGLFRAAFASETPPTPAQLQVVWGFLRDESIEPSVFLRMRERYPERTQDVMRLVLKDRLFRLDEDFEPTLRKFKGRAMRKPPKAALSLVDAADVPAFRERQQRREAEAARASG
jgi:hypothetical protein